LNNQKEGNNMKRVYFKIQWNGENDVEQPMIDAYQYSEWLFIHRTYQGEGWQVSHKCGMGIVGAKTFNNARVIAFRLHTLCPNWSDAEKESTGEKYADVRNYVFKLNNPNWR
jgi:hypothetical protein